MHVDKLVPDTSVIIEGILSKRILEGSLTCTTLLIHEAVINELEAQANRNKETGQLGLEEIKKLRQICKERTITLQYAGERPSEFDIKNAAKGGIDSLIRQYAFEQHATLITADKVQASVAESKGIPVILVEFTITETPFVLEKYFDENTAAVIIREGCTPQAKKGKPGSWTLIPLGDERLDRDAMRKLSTQIVEDTASRKDGFLEWEQKGTTLAQAGKYRVLITKPPLTDGYEITASTHLKQLQLTDYSFQGEKHVLASKGLLIIGGPGEGKTTFAQALANHYVQQQRIVKTIESPRDLVVNAAITKFSLHHATPQDLHDIMLLSRPDNVIFDEARTLSDIRLFCDLRLSGISVAVVMHAEHPAQAVQRFIGKIEPSLLPSLITHIIHIAAGQVKSVSALRMQGTTITISDGKDTTVLHVLDKDAIITASARTLPFTVRSDDQDVHFSTDATAATVELFSGNDLLARTTAEDGSFSFKKRTKEGRLVQAAVEKGTLTIKTRN
ncbi:MAG: ATPase, T2SS/T4P/T4SS family [archaeon]